MGVQGVPRDSTEAEDAPLSEDSEFSELESEGSDLPVEEWSADSEEEPPSSTCCLCAWLSGKKSSRVLNKGQPATSFDLSHRL